MRIRAPAMLPTAIPASAPGERLLFAGTGAAAADEDVLEGELAVRDADVPLDDEIDEEEDDDDDDDVEEVDDVEDVVDVVEVVVGGSSA